MDARNAGDIPEYTRWTALSTTGPLAQVAAESPISYAGIPESAQFVLALTMVLGRLETLALIALFNPAFWRS